MTISIYFLIAAIIFFVCFTATCYFPNHYKWAEFFRINNNDELLTAIIFWVVISVLWYVVLLALPFILFIGIRYYVK